MRPEVYIGDGLYARYDGYMIILRAPRGSGDHWVGLEPDVLMSFIRFIESQMNVTITITKNEEEKEGDE